MQTPQEIIEETWFRAEGFEQRPLLAIHPQDEMFRSDVLHTHESKRRLYYMRSGYEARLVFENVLAAAGRTLSSEEAVLDFAGGFARMLRFLALDLPADRLWLSDILPGTVEFARDTFGVHAFPSEESAADITFPRSYSAIWVGSLFSHLPRPTFETFLRGLYRALAPNGILIFSVLSPDELPAEQRDPSGFTFLPFSESKELDPEAYGSTFVTRPVLEEICRGQGIDRLWHLPHELWRIQDLCIVTRGDLELDGLQPTRVVRGSIDRVTIDAAGHFWIGGWARVPRGETILEIVLLIGDEERPALHEPLGETLPAADGGENFHQVNWYTEGPAGAITTETPIAAIAYTESGARSCFDVSFPAAID